MGTSSLILPGHYDYGLVALSISISILAAYASLDLAERVTTTRGGSRLAWLYGGAAAMGIGIWAMHYVGMVALHLPVPVMYDWPTLLLSLFIAILASGAALFVVSGSTMGPLRTIIGSIIMGCGIAAMHYVGMDAMRLQAICIYSPGLVVLSVILAVAISFVALQLTFAGRQNHISWGWEKLWSGLILGLAIPIMHYVGMAAVSFMPKPDFSHSLQHAVAIYALRPGCHCRRNHYHFAACYAVSMFNRRFAPGTAIDGAGNTTEDHLRQPHGRNPRPGQEK